MAQPVRKAPLVGVPVIASMAALVTGDYWILEMQLAKLMNNSPEAQVVAHGWYVLYLLAHL